MKAELWTCALCDARALVGSEVGEEMLRRALEAFYRCGRIEDGRDFEDAMREAIAAALEVA